MCEASASRLLIAAWFALWKQWAAREVKAGEPVIWMASLGPRPRSATPPDHGSHIVARSSHSQAAADLQCVELPESSLRQGPAYAAHASVTCRALFLELNDGNKDVGSVNGRDEAAIPDIHKVRQYSGRQIAHLVRLICRRQLKPLQQLVEELGQCDFFHSAWRCAIV
jgi:hypothetical protein